MKKLGVSIRMIFSMPQKISIVAGLLFLASSAQASIWQLNDGFEDANPAAVWGFWAAGTGAGGFELGTGTARSGNNNAWIYSMNGWSDVGRNVRITPFFFGRKMTCAAQINVQGLAIKGQLEVIDSATWTYTSVKPFSINSGSYVSVLTSPWVPSGQNVYVRLGLIGVTGSFMFARVDDLIVQCAYN